MYVVEYLDADLQVWYCVCAMPVDVSAHKGRCASQESVQSLTGEKNLWVHKHEEVQSELAQARAER